MTDNKVPKLLLCAACFLVCSIWTLVRMDTSSPPLDAAMIIGQYIASGLVGAVCALILGAILFWK